jgi:PPE-repeat protein
LINNTASQYPTGGWGLGFTGGSSGNLNSMRQILQAYFAVGLGNFGYGLGQQLLTPAQATALEKGLGLMPATAGGGLPGLGGLGAGLGGGTAGVSGAPFTASSVSAALGESNALGRLSVPASWSQAASPQMQEVRLVGSARPVAGAPASNAILNGVPMSGGAGLGGRGGGAYTVKYGVKHTVMPRPPVGG